MASLMAHVPDTVDQVVDMRFGILADGRPETLRYRFESMDARTNITDVVQFKGVKTNSSFHQ